MVGPQEWTAPELERYGLGVVRRGAKSTAAVTLLYCLRCGTQVSPERRDTDPDGWWECARKCNTLYAQTPRTPPSRIAP